MSDDDKKPISIESFLDIEVQTPNTKLPEVVQQLEGDKEEPVSHAQDDYEFARRQLRDVITNGQNLFQHASDVATQGQQAEHYEVAASILNGLVSASKELMNLSQTHQKVTGAGQKQEAKKVTNNLFVGSTAELMKLIKKNKTDGSE